MKKLTPHAGQEKVLSDKESEFRVVVAGRRFGKTTLAIKDSVKQATETKRRVLFLAAESRVAKTVVWERLLDELKREDIEKIFPDMLLVLKNGSTLKIMAADGLDALRGRVWDSASIDEIQLMHDETLDRVRAARYLITGTPPLYLKGTVSPGWESYRFASFENPHEAEKMKKLKEHMWIYEKILRRPFTPV